MAQTLKRLPTMQETQVQFLGCEDLLEILVQILSTVLNKWQPTPVFSPGKSHGWRSLAGYSHKESNMTERLHTHTDTHTHTQTHTKVGHSFIPRSKCLLIPWLQSPSAVILEPSQK